MGPRHSRSCGRGCMPSSSRKQTGCWQMRSSGGFSCIACSKACSRKSFAGLRWRAKSSRLPPPGAWRVLRKDACVCGWCSGRVQVRVGLRAENSAAPSCTAHQAGLTNFEGWCLRASAIISLTPHPLSRRLASERCALRSECGNARNPHRQPLQHSLPLDAGRLMRGGACYLIEGSATEPLHLRNRTAAHAAHMPLQALILRVRARQPCTAT